MTEEVKKRIEDINNGIVPEGYKKTKFGIIPNDWKETQLKNCLKRVSRPVDVDSDTIYKQIGIRSHGKGIFYKEDVTGKELGNKSVFWIEPDCFILNIVFAWEQAIGKTTENEVGMIASHRFPMYKTINTDTDFLISYLLTKKGTELLEDASPGGAGRNKTLGQEAFLKSKVFFPDLAEQNKIARILSTQDEIILYQEQKVEELKNLKRAYLTKMFPQKGSKYPEIRFKDFTDAWEQRELGDAASFSKGSGYSKNDLVESGTPIILYGRLYTKYETTISDVDTYVNATPNSVYSKGNEVIVPASGETAEDISRASYVAKSGILLGGDLNIIMPDEYINPVFLALTISNGEQQKELSKRAQGKSVVHIHNFDLEKIMLLYPSYEEQEKIGQYFTNFDTLITLHQRKLEAEKKKKKALMQLLLTGKVRVKV